MTQPQPAPTSLPATRVFRLHATRLTQIAGESRASAPKRTGRPGLSLVPQPKSSQQLATPTKEPK